MEDISASFPPPSTSHRSVDCPSVKGAFGAARSAVSPLTVGVRRRAQFMPGGREEVGQVIVRA